jgi:HSP20 family protein
MRNSTAIIIGVILLFAFGMQVFMFYSIHEKLNKQFNVRKNLDLSSHQGQNTWYQDSDTWNPYQELLQMRGQMEQIFNDSFSRVNTNPNVGSLTRFPAVDVKNEEDRYIVKADVPDGDEGSLKVTLNGRQLTISIKTKGETEQKDDKNKYEYHERFSGEFLRSLTLPGEVKEAGMKSEITNGVLTVIVPKK